MGQTELVILPPVVRLKDILDSTPHGLDGISVIPSVRIDERDGVTNSAVRVTDGPNIPVRSPAITDDSSAGFDPSTYYIHQCVGGSIQYRNKECSAGLTFNTAKHPLSLNRVSPMVFTLTELALVDFNGLVRTADLLRAALQVNQHSLSAEHTPVSDRVISELMFMLDVMARFAAQDVIGEVEDLLEGKVTVVEPRTMPDRPRLRTPDSTYHPPTSPPETIRNSGICVPSHITTA
jgi:hypothetical protein